MIITCIRLEYATKKKISLERGKYNYDCNKTITNEINFSIK